MECEEYKEFTKAVIALDGLYRAGEIISDNVGYYAYQTGLIRDFFLTIL